jgi:hypothetical protein
MPSTNHPKITKFYEDHPALNFESMNLLLIDLLYPVISSADISPNLLNAFTQQFQQDFENWKKSFKEENGNLQELQFTKTQLLFENLPKENKKLIEQITNILNPLSAPVPAILDEKNLEPFLQTFEKRIQLALEQCQKILQNQVNQTESHLIQQILQTGTQLNQIQNLTGNQIQTQSTLHQDVNTLLQKFGNSTSKGATSELGLEIVLNKIFPDSSIEMVSDQAESGDFQLKCDNKPTILIENKNYSKNVNTDEVNKFLRDVEINKIPGVLFSQTSGISNKKNYQVDVHKGNAVIFVHNVNYDNDKIRIAIEILYHFYSLTQILNIPEQQQSVILTREILDKIGEEYNKFAHDKHELKTNIEDSYKKSIKIIERMNFPELLTIFPEDILVKLDTGLFYCDQCSFSTSTLKKLSAHKRVHNKNNSYTSCTSSESLDNLIEETTQQSKSQSEPIQKKEKKQKVPKEPKTPKSKKSPKTNQSTQNTV